MATYDYVAEATDGKQRTQQGTVEATDKSDAEKKVKAKYSWDVRVIFPSALDSIGSVKGTGGGTYQSDSAGGLGGLGREGKDDVKK